jgi:hypothetical protein
MKLKPFPSVAAACLAGAFGLPAVAIAQAPAPAPAPAPAAPTSNAMTTPAMSASISANPNPFNVDLGPILGKTYVTGELTGMLLGQTNPAVGGFPSGRTWEADLTNGMGQVQKTDGLFQYFLQVGGYSFPTVGVPYSDASHTNTATFGLVPVGYVKLAPSDSLSIEAGKLPTLIGQEYAFTFQNLNLERGLLWNQENIINRGVQLNYTAGPLAFAVSWNDGFYTNDYTYFTGSVTWTVDPANTIIFAGGGNASTTTTAVPLSNEQQYDLSWTWASGPWTVNPYVQYTYVPSVVGVSSSGQTYGAALLLNYAFDDTFTLGGYPLGGFSLPFRAEYLASQGSVATGANLVGYGPHSNAWSLTVTPTYQYKIAFARTELSYTNASSTTTAVFGPSGTDKNQVRVLLEAGLVF